jgi:hypothetical protein
MWQHGNFHISVDSLSPFFETFHKEATNRIQSLDIDVTYADSWTSDEMQIAEYLRPLCQEGRLQRVVISGDLNVYQDRRLCDVRESNLRCDEVAQHLKNSYLAPSKVGRAITVEHHWDYEKPEW